MSVPDIVRNVTKNVREALSSREEFKEKTTKDLPLYVLQSALSGVGQALQFGGRVKDRIRRLAGQDRDEETDTTETTEQATGETPADKPARREPVIFAPRPSQEKPEEVRETVEPKAEANGAKARPEPVIFTPAKPAAKPVAAETPAETPEPPAAAVTETPAVETPAETPAQASSQVTTPEAPAAPEVAEAPAVEAPEIAEVQVVEESALVEPMPGYSALTVASLRARMRGKSAEQIGDLLAYERATSDRPEVVRMYENRLAKLRAAE